MDAPPPPPPPPTSRKSSLFCGFPTVRKRRRPSSQHSPSRTRSLLRALPGMRKRRRRESPTASTGSGSTETLRGSPPPVLSGERLEVQVAAQVPMVVRARAQSVSPPVGAAGSDPAFYRSRTPSPESQPQTPTPGFTGPDTPGTPAFDRSDAPSLSSRGTTSQKLRSGAPSPSSATPSKRARAVAEVPRSDAPSPSSFSARAEEREGGAPSASARGAGSGGEGIWGEALTRSGRFIGRSVPTGSAPVPASAFHTQDPPFGPLPPLPPREPLVPPADHYFMVAHARVDDPRTPGAESQVGEPSGSGHLSARGIGAGHYSARAGGGRLGDWIEQGKESEAAGVVVSTEMAGVEGGGTPEGVASHDEGGYEEDKDVDMGGNNFMDDDITMEEFLAMDGVENTTGHTGDENGHDNFDNFDETMGNAPVGHPGLPFHERTPDLPDSSMPPPPPPPPNPLPSSVNRPQVQSSSSGVQLPRDEVVMLERERRFRRLIGEVNPPGCACGRLWGREGGTWDYCRMHRWIRQLEEIRGEEKGTTTPRDSNGREPERGRKRYRD